MSNLKLYLRAFHKTVYLFIVIVLFGCSKGGSNSGLYDAVPLNAAVIIKINDPLQFVEDLLLNNKFYDELKLYKDFSTQTTFLSDLYEKIDKNKHLRKFFKESKIIISTHLVDRNTAENLYFISTPENNEDKLESFTTFFKKGTLSKSKTYEGKDIYKLVHSGAKTIYCAEFQNKIIVSKNIFLIEDALRQIKSKNKINTFKEFQQVEKTADSNELINIYINYDFFPKILTHYFDCNPGLTYNQNVASWSEFDLDMSSESFLLNGYTFTHKLGNDYFKILIDQPSFDSSIEEVIPSSVTNFFRIQLSDINKYKSNYYSYLKKCKKMGSLSQTISDFENFDIDIEDLYFRIIEKEVAFVNTRINNGVTFTVINTIGKSQTKKIYSEIIERYCDEKKLDKSKFELNYKIDDETTYKVYKLPFNNLAGKLFGNIYNDKNNRFYTFFENYLIFGPDVNSLMKYVKENILNKTLETNQEYQDFKSNIPQNASFYFYINLPFATSNVHGRLAHKYKKLLESNINFIRKIKGLAIQYSPQDELIYGNIFLQYQDDILVEKNTIWETFINKNLIIKPQFVLNHYTRNYEIMVQDEDFNLYLINSAGRVRWKRKLNGKILSDIEQVDFYNNRKLQYLFNTENKVYLLDRNNNPVEKFPINLAHKATTGISIFDYDKKRDFRIFVPCADKRIYIYDLNTRLITGWRHGKFETQITKPVKWTRISGKDYILVVDKNRVYILNRRGEERVKIPNNFALANNSELNLEYDYISGKSHLVSTDKNGVINKLSFSGKLTKSKIRNFSPNHFFTLSDIDGNGSKERIFVDQNKLLVYNHNNTIKFEYNFKNNITSPPCVYKFSSKDIKIGIADIKDEKIFLINNMGELDNNFPLVGNTLFSIGYTNRENSHFNLIVGNSDNFLLNYKFIID